MAKEIDSAENRTALLKAIGLNDMGGRSSTAVTKLNLPEMERLIAAGIPRAGEGARRAGAHLVRARYSEHS